MAREAKLFASSAARSCAHTSNSEPTLRLVGYTTREGLASASSLRSAITLSAGAQCTSENVPIISKALVKITST